MDAVLNEMFEFVTDENILKELEHIFEDDVCEDIETLETKLTEKRQRSNLEIKYMLANVLGETVKKTFAKRKFNDDFSKADMIKINQIDEFLRNICFHQDEEMCPDTRKKYLFFCFRSTYQRKDGTIIETFYNKQVCQDDFDYKKIDKYLAKCLYRLCCNRHIEVFFAVNSFKALHEGRFYRVDRKKQNLLSSHAIYCDIDLPKELQENLSDVELLDFVKEKYDELYRNLKWSYAIKSGSGIHLYYALDKSVYLENEDQVEKYKEVLRELQENFCELGSDIRCIDAARLLRLPFSFNRKQKFGKDHKEVQILEYNDVSYDMLELKNKLSFVKNGGMQQLFQDVLEDVFPYCYDTGDEQQAVIQNYEIENQEAQEEIENYESAEVQEVIENYEMEETEEGIEKIEIENQEPQEVIDNCEDDGADKCRLKFFKYKGIQKHYDFGSETYYLCKDMMVWLLNRNWHETVRHSMFFYFNYCWYVFNEVRTYDELLKRSLELNKLFKPKLDEDEITKLVEYNLSYLKLRNQNHKGIKHTKVMALLNYTNEELEILFGVYAYTEEELMQKRKEKNKLKCKAYNAKQREQKSKLPNPKQKIREQQMEIIKNNPLISFKEFHELTGLSKMSFYNLKRQLNLSKEKRKELSLEHWLNPFYENESITVSEYTELMNCCKCCYYKYKRIFSKIKNDTEE